MVVLYLHASMHLYLMFKRSLEAKLPSIWTDGREAELGRNSGMEKVRREVRREKMQARKKVGKSRNTVFFQ